MTELVPVVVSPSVHVPIIEVRGTKVVLDQDLAALYEVETRVLNQAVKRKREHFPEDWLFQLTAEEFADLRSRGVIASETWGGRRTPPWAFTEHGVVIASTLLQSDRAIQMKRYVVEAFVSYMREASQAGELLPAEINSVRGPTRIELIQSHLDTLLRQQLDSKTGATVGDKTWALVDGTFENVRERLRKEGLKSAEIEARIQSMAADREKTGAEAERIKVGTQISALKAALIAEKAMTTEDTSEFIALMNAMNT